MSAGSAQRATAAFLGIFFFTCCEITRGQAVPANPGVQNSPAAAVTVSEDQTSFTLSNGIVTAKVNKKTGDIFSMVYKDIETLTSQTGHGGGFWSEDTAAGTSIVDKIT
ncbi:MAG: hypothetical protein ABSH22_01530, partial [Tepidisphaeraceae bacterium]